MIDSKLGLRCAAGRLLLGGCPEGESLRLGLLLESMARGARVRKTWLRGGAGQGGGSTRVVRCSPGAGGRLSLAYPSGLLRITRTVAVRR